MLKIISNLFGGSKSDKDVKQLEPKVQEINEYFEKYKSYSNDELRNNSVIFKNRIEEYLSDIKAEIATKKQQLSATNPEDFETVNQLMTEIDELEKHKDDELEKVLLEILPEAFATIKETARRFTELDEITATATELDKDLTVNKSYISIDGDQATYQTTWDAAGTEVTWNMVHYDVQLIGGIVLHQGRIAEMATGEGKTLVSTLPAYLNALSGEGVHIVTVNDYLARRDQEWNTPIFEWLGVTTDCIDKHTPNSVERRKAYNADITYGTNNEFGFDYLRDNMVHSKEQMVQRKLHYAMIDEVDSVLIDDARTPLIISGPVSSGGQNEELFFALKPRIETLVNAQRKAVNKFLIDAKKQIAEGNDDKDTGGLSLYRAYRGLPKNSALIKYLSEPGIKQNLQKVENYYLGEQQRHMPIVLEELYFTIDEKNNQVDLTDKGIDLITKTGESADDFMMPDLGTEMAKIEATTSDPKEQAELKDKMLNDYASTSERIHTIQQLLKAYTLFEKDVEYIVVDEKVKIVDEQTGRVMEGRRYSDGLHQALEAKENVKIEAATQTHATITLQNYFRMYHKLAGMTGTAETEAAELYEIYKLDVVSIPTNLPIAREDQDDNIYKTAREKYNAVIEEVVQLTEQGRPVLVGTTSVEISELLSRMLNMRKIKHNVLNAKQHGREANVVAEAGLPGNVTIATNMAGRGTDIKLGPGVKEAGGLAIIGTERHESRRVDRQLRGRAGRQGDPGSSRFYVSLEDSLMRLFGSERLAKMMDTLGHKEGEVLRHKVLTKRIEGAQKKVEENNFGMRKRLLDYDDVMNAQRDVVYKRRKNALYGDRIALDIENAFYAIAQNIAALKTQELGYEGFIQELLQNYATESPLSETEYNNTSADKLVDPIYHALKDTYKRKMESTIERIVPDIQRIKDNNPQIENIFIPFTDGIRGLQALVPIDKLLETNGRIVKEELEKSISLASIDDSWKDHLRAMDDLKTSVQSAVYEQKDPLLIYKFEAFEQFKETVYEINKSIVEFLSRSFIPESQQVDQREAVVQKDDLKGMQTNKQENGDATQTNRTQAKPEPVRVEPKIGRNEPCPCGSGKKYKQCHGKA